MMGVYEREGDERHGREVEMEEERAGVVER